MTRAVLGRLRRSLDEAPPHTIAATVALGLTLGVFPLYGAPTLLCIGAAIVFRPHVPLLQAINLAASPLQLALALPFHRIGAWLLPNLAGTAHPKGRLLAAAAQMVVGWLLISVPGGAAAYVIATRSLLWRRSFRS